MIKVGIKTKEEMDLFVNVAILTALSAIEEEHKIGKKHGKHSNSKA